MQTEREKERERVKEVHEREVERERERKNIQLDKLCKGRQRQKKGSPHRQWAIFISFMQKLSLAYP